MPVSRQASLGFFSASCRSSLHSHPTTSTSQPPFPDATATPIRCSPPSRLRGRRPRPSSRPPNPAPPLSDVTNLLLPETPTPVKPRRSGRRPLPQPSDDASTCSSSASVTPAPKRSSAAVLEEECSVFKSPAIATVYARRGPARAEATGKKEAPTTSKGKSKGKGKGKGNGKESAAGTASCPQLGKSTRNSSRETSMAQETRPISSSAPCHEAKKKRPLSSTTKLPEDFVKKQRAYFADVDAFELPVEEVSETDLD